jgi:comEA protein
VIHYNIHGVLVISNEHTMNEFDFEQVVSFLKKHKVWVASFVGVLVVAGVAWFVPGIRTALASGAEGIRGSVSVKDVEAERIEAEHEKRQQEEVKALQDELAMVKTKAEEALATLGVANTRMTEAETGIRDVLQEMSGTDALLAKQYKELQASIRRVNQNVALANNIQLPDIVENLAPSEESPAPGQSGKINLNTATAAQLDELPGIGLTYANRIIEYREKNGNFKTLEGVMEVSGIGESLFAKIKDLITL